MLRAIGKYFLIFLLAGCASTPLDRYLETVSDIPQSAQVGNVPFLAQKRNHCGPASLAMVMGWAGKPVSADELADTMFTPLKEGTYRADLVGAARRRGFLTIPVGTFDSLFREVAAGNPVIVYENVGFRWYPKWHFAVVIGYDLTRKRVTLHSADEANQEISLRRFEDDWIAGERWAVAVLPPKRLSATGDELAHLTAAAALERVERLDDAGTAYASILKRWPQSLGAWIGTGNVRYAERDFEGATRALKRATRYHAGAAAAWHNLALAYRETKQRNLAKWAARKAIALADRENRDTYRQSLVSLLK